MGQSIHKLVWLLALIAWSVPNLARAQPSGAEPDQATRLAAANLGYAGLRAFRTGDYETAVKKLDDAFRLVQVPTLGLWSARTKVKLGRWVEAAERLTAVTRLVLPQAAVAVHRQAQLDAAADLRALIPRIPALVLHVEGAALRDVVIVIDGRRVGAGVVGNARPINPGKRRIEAWRGQEHVVVELVFAEKERKAALLRFEPARKSRAPPRDSARTAGFVVLGVGAAGAGVGLLSAVVAMNVKEKLDERGACDGNQCLRSERELVDQYETARQLSTISFALGVGAMAAGGVVLLAARSFPRETKKLALRVGPGFAALSGAF